VTEISKILAYEVMKGWKDFDHPEIETPLAKTKVDRIVHVPVVVSIMRAGNGMLEGALSMIPFASAGFIGIYRDKFVNTTVEYYFKMPTDIKGRTAILCDPLIATGDTISAAIERLKSYEVKKIQIQVAESENKDLSAVVLDDNSLMTDEFTLIGTRAGIDDPFAYSNLSKAEIETKFRWSSKIHMAA
jgi:uracil phosphoribosyltransferase